MRNRQRNSNNRQSGFTLTELMIVVTIAGILASLAIPQLQKYRLRARGWQAEEFLQSISLRQEFYRSEFGRYRSSNDSACDAFPLAHSCFNPSAAGLKGESAPFAQTTAWREIGALPAGQVYFGFAVVAGTPADIPVGLPWNLQQDFWWIAQASGDIDKDNTYAIFELTSQSRRVWINSDKGYD